MVRRSVLLSLLLVACDDAPKEVAPDAAPRPVTDRDVDGVPDIDDLCPDDPDPEQGDLDGDGRGDACDVDDDGDGVVDGADGCPTVPDPDRVDTDLDGVGDACDDDDDNDGVPDARDPCPLQPGDLGVDSDGDGRGDACDDDADGDGVDDAGDNCPGLANGDQADDDADGIGDACDGDLDDDGVDDAGDNCPGLANAEQADGDEDGVGDACDDDLDGDDAPDTDDNCPGLANVDQADVDGDGRGDACDPCPADPDDDADADGVCGEIDNCPATANAEQADGDGDGRGDGCDVCPADPADDEDADGVCAGDDNCVAAANAGQADTDGDGMGDACDPCVADASNDLDGDGICGDLDRCPADADPDQGDVDGDGLGDACDPCPEDADNDADGDGRCAGEDLCPETPDPEQADADGDGICAADRCPEVPDPGQADADEDGRGDACDPCPNDPADDADGDGRCAGEDLCPAVFDPFQDDADGDGIGDGCDADRDGDGVDDAVDNCLLVPNADQLDAFGDARGDACEWRYFHEGFEAGLAGWVVESGDWAVGEEAALVGLRGLGDSPGGVPDALGGSWTLVSPGFDLSEARQPRLVFAVRFELTDQSLWVEALSGGEVRWRRRVLYEREGRSSRIVRRLAVDLSELAGEAEVSLRFGLDLGGRPGDGVHLDEVVVEEPPRGAARGIPVRGRFDRFEGWERFGGALQDVGGAARLPSEETLFRATTSLRMRGRVDLRGATRPVLDLWHRNGAFDEAQRLEVRLWPSEGPSVTHVLDAAAAGNGLRQRGRVALEAHAGDPALGIEIRFVSDSSRLRDVFFDEWRVHEPAERAALVAPVEVPADALSVDRETDGWARVEEPEGVHSLRALPDRWVEDSRARASVGVFDLSCPCGKGA